MDLLEGRRGGREGRRKLLSRSPLLLGRREWERIGKERKWKKRMEETEREKRRGKDITYNSGTLPYIMFVCFYNKKVQKENVEKKNSTGHQIL